MAGAGICVIFGNNTEEGQRKESYIGENEDDPNWIWDLTGLETNAPIMGIEFDQNLDDPGDKPPAIGSTTASAVAPGAVSGDTITLPNSFNQLNRE